MHLRRTGEPVGLLSAFLVAALFGCGGDDESGRADGRLDAQGRGDVFDGAVGEAAFASNFGELCQGAGGCKPGSPSCLTFDTVTPRGICTKQCVSDDPLTVIVNEDTCPIGFTCAALAAGQQFCVKTCQPKLTENTCPLETGLACRPDSSRLVLASRRAVCWLPACRSGRDCPVITEETCKDDSVCKTEGRADAFCLQSESRCALPGNCTKSGICGPHGRGKAEALVGDPCRSDLDCTTNGFCLIEQKAQETQGVLWRNGYCSVANCAFSSDLPEFECAAGSTCHLGYPAGLCHRVCSLEEPNSCRRDKAAGDRGGDYECYSFEAIVTVDRQTLADQPVCEAARSCDKLGVGVQCSDLGREGNTTEMVCRNPQSGQPTASPEDSAGLCLDDSSSGEFGSEPQSGDAGVGGADSGA